MSKSQPFHQSALHQMTKTQWWSEKLWQSAHAANTCQGFSSDGPCKRIFLFSVCDSNTTLPSKGCKGQEIKCRVVWNLVKESLQLLFILLGFRLLFFLFHHRRLNAVWLGYKGQVWDTCGGHWGAWGHVCTGMLCLLLLHRASDTDTSKKWKNCNWPNGRLPLAHLCNSRS